MSLPIFLFVCLDARMVIKAKSLRSQAQQIIFRFFRCGREVELRGLEPLTS